MERLSMIAAVGAQNRVIGRDNTLPWSKPLIADLKRFRQLTLGNVVFMGLNTWHSLPGILSGRICVVVSTSMIDAPKDVIGCPTLCDAIALADANFKAEGFIMGGARMYEEGLAFATRLYITEVDESPEGATFFPDYSSFSRVIEECVEPNFSPRLTYRTLERP